MCIRYRLGVIIAGTLPVDDPLKGWIAGVAGLLIAGIGQEPQYAYERFSYGVRDLAGGIQLVPALVGAFGFAELLKLELENPEHRGYVEIIEQSGGHLLNLVNETLDLAKIESGEMRFNQIRTPLTELVSESAAGFRTSAEAKGLTFQLDFATDLPAEITGGELDRSVSAQLKGLPEKLAARVARHLAAAGMLIDEDPETAYQHTLAARALSLIHISEPTKPY